MSRLCSYALSFVWPVWALAYAGRLFTFRRYIRELSSIPLVYLTKRSTRRSTLNAQSTSRSNHNPSRRIKHRTCNPYLFNGTRRAPSGGNTTLDSLSKVEATSAGSRLASRDHRHVLWHALGQFRSDINIFWRP